MMELCKSESDEETPETEEKIEKTEQDTEKPSDIPKTDNDTLTEKSDITNVLAENLENDLPAILNDDIDTEKVVDETNTISPEEDLLNNETENVLNNENENATEPNDEQNSSVKDDSNTDFKLVYNDSVEEEQMKIDDKDNTEIADKEVTNQVDTAENSVEQDNNSELQTKGNTEEESQLISLHYTENNSEQIKENTEEPEASNVVTDTKVHEERNEVVNNDFFSDDDVDMEDIDKLIENAEILRGNYLLYFLIFCSLFFRQKNSHSIFVFSDDDNISSPMLVKDPPNLNAKPKLTGAPGMVIDLDGGSVMSKKTGVELLKERFTYFAKLKTPEELEREKEKRFVLLLVI